MIQHVSQINPYLFVSTRTVPVGVHKNSIPRTANQLRKESKNLILNLLCISRDGVYVKTMKNFTAISGSDVSDVDNILKEMLNQRVIQIRKEKYLITERKLQSELYRKLGSKWRSNYHHYYGCALSETYRYDKSKLPEKAEHFWKAGNMMRSREYLEKAGDYQKETHRNTDAIRNYNQCMSILGENEEGAKLDIMLKMMEIMYTTGKWDEFNAMYHEAEEMSKKLGDRESRAKVLNLSGSVSFFRGEVDKAIKTFHKAETLMLDNTMSYTYAETIRFLGRSFLQMGKNDKAEEFFYKTLRVGEKIGNDELKAKALENIGRIYRLKGNYAKALSYYRKAQLIFRKIGDLKGVNMILEKMGVISFYLNKYENSLSYFKQSYRLSNHLNDKISICNNYGNIGSVYFKMIKFLKAETYYKKQHNLAKLLGNVDLKAKSIGCLGLINEEKGLIHIALSYFEYQLKLYKSIDNLLGVSNALSNLSLMQSYLGNFEIAIKTTLKQLDIDKEISNNDGLIRGLNNLGSFYLNLMKYKDAIRLFNKALKLCKENNNEMFKKGILYNISECHYYLGHYKDALNIINNLKLSDSNFIKKKIEISFHKLTALLESDIIPSINNLNDMYNNENTIEIKSDIRFTISELVLRKDLRDKEWGHYIENTIKYLSSIYKSTNKIQYLLKIQKLNS